MRSSAVHCRACCSTRPPYATQASNSGRSEPLRQACDSRVLNACGPPRLGQAMLFFAVFEGVKRRLLALALV